LRIGWLKREDEHVLVDRMAGKLPRWKGRLMNKSARLTLINSVLSSIVLYHMTVFTLSKWAIKKIDKIGRNFLWHGSENARGGRCLVNWKLVQRPKKLSGLGILELSHFNKALRLHWQLLQWTDPSKPWSTMKIPNSAAKANLFRACTKILVGDGAKTKFWQDRWLEGSAPSEIVPALVKFAWRKNILVASGMDGAKWMKGLHRILTAQEFNQFINL
jgi:hypothetical protein